MFRMLKLQPPHGWRAVLWELGIVTIGVLTALSAEQLVQTIHWNRDVEQTRSALDAELAFNLAAFDYRIKQRECVAARLTELNAVIARQRQGQGTSFEKAISGPVGFGVRFAVWEAASGEARSRIPFDAKLQYAALYDMLQNYISLRTAEKAEWDKLQDFDFAAPMDRRDLQQTTGAVRRLEGHNALLSGMILFRRALAQPLHIEAQKAIESTIGDLAQANQQALCAPLV